MFDLVFDVVHIGMLSSVLREWLWDKDYIFICMSVVFMTLQSTALICCLSDRPVMWTVSVQNTVYTTLEILLIFFKFKTCSIYYSSIKNNITQVYIVFFLFLNFFYLSTGMLKINVLKYIANTFFFSDTKEYLDKMWFIYQKQLT